MMSTKKDIFDNWTEWRMCGDCYLVNNCMCSNKYAMPLLKEIFDALSQAKVFNTLDLKSNYHQLPLKEGDKVTTAFWEIDLRGKDYLYQWQFLPFNFNNAPTQFQRVMDQVLVGLGFAKCYINDIIIFNLTSKDRKHHPQEVFERLKNHNLKFHPGKCRFFQTKVEYLGHMIYLSGLGGIEGQS